MGLFKHLHALGPDRPFMPDCHKMLLVPRLYLYRGVADELE
jgi:hypothetical protein